MTFNMSKYAQTFVYNSTITKHPELNKNDRESHFNATTPKQSISPVSFSVMYKLHTVLRCIYLYRRTYTHAHTKAVSVFKTPTYWEAQQNIFTKFFSKRKTAVTRYTCTSIMAIQTTLLLPLAFTKCSCTCQTLLTFFFKSLHQIKFWRCTAVFFLLLILVI